MKYNFGLKMKEDDILFYIMVVLGLIIIGTIMYFLYGEGKCFESFTDKPSLIYYYMENCPHCRDFNSEWDKIVVHKDIKDKINTVKIDIEDQKNKEEVDKYKISGAPTILFVKNGNKVEYENERKVDDIVKFVKAQ